MTKVPFVEHGYLAHALQAVAKFAKIGTDLAGSECLEGASVPEKLVKLGADRLQ